ncbi:MAG: DUF2332 family protein [Salaquimonas sp.]|nr:DUF2332 family protein [Salaquimonas sp.]
MDEEAIRSIFLRQTAACEKLGSPFTGRVCRLLAQRLDSASKIGAIVFGWQGNPDLGADSVPLRLCGALNNLVLIGADPGLAEVYPPKGGDSDDEKLWREIARALDEHAGHIAEFLKSAPQTNEVRRSAILLAGWSWIATHFGRPLVVSEVGASAGLNLFAERYLLKTDDFERGRTGSPVVLPASWYGETPLQAEINVIERAGCDLAPIDPSDKAQRDRLISYIWPDQRDRVERTEAAIAMAGKEGTPVEQADAADWLERRLARKFEGAVHVVQHTITWQYFPESVKAWGEVLLEEAGARATPERPLARLSFEADGQNYGAAVGLTLWPGERSLSLGRADYHGRWVDWRNPVV